MGEVASRTNYLKDDCQGVQKLREIPLKLEGIYAQIDPWQTWGQYHETKIQRKTPPCGISLNFN